MKTTKADFGIQDREAWDTTPLGRRGRFPLHVSAWFSLGWRLALSRPQVSDRPYFL